MNILVLGGGLTGLSTAYRLSTNGDKVRVIERQSQVGGLAKSLHYENFVVDLGPHRFFTKNKSLLEYVVNLTDGCLNEVERKSRIHMLGRFFDYPLKASNAIFTLPPTDSARILLDYLFVFITGKFKTQSDETFEDWVVNRFGRKLYAIYFGPYTEKVWGVPPKEISADWASQRISLTSLWDTIIKTLAPSGQTPRTFTSKFHYPCSGGIGFISEKFRQACEKNNVGIELNSEVSSVTTEDDKIKLITVLNESEEKEYSTDFLFSTIPVTTLVESLNPKPPKPVRKASRGLMYRAIIFCYIVTKNRISIDDHWIYFPNDNILFNRLSFPRNFAKNNADFKGDIICAEVTCFTGDKLWQMDVDELKQKVLDDLYELDFVRKEDVKDFFIHREEHGYPVYNLAYQQNLESVLDYLKKFDNLVSAGRNGLFRYNNMDHCIETGFSLAENVALGKPITSEFILEDKAYFG